MGKVKDIVLRVDMENTMIYVAPSPVSLVLTANLQTKSLLLAKGHLGNCPKTANQKNSTSTTRVLSMTIGLAYHAQTVLIALNPVATPCSP